MTTKVKTSIILLSTLVIGVAVGALASGALRDRREHEIHRMPPHHRFLKSMHEIIQPTEGQADALDHILDRRSKQLSELSQRHQNEVLAIMDSMRTELASVLTEKQRVRLEAQLAKGMRRGLTKRMARLNEELQLNDEQAKRIREIMADFEEARPKRHNRRGGPPHAFRGEMRERFAKIHQDVETVLTPEQRERYRKMVMQRDFLGGPRSKSPLNSRMHTPAQPDKER